MNVKRELARGSVMVSGITFVGHILSTGLKLLVSRNFGLVGFGQYALIMAFSRFLSTVVQMGYNQSIVHFVSKYRVKQDWVNIKYYFVEGAKHILKVALVVSLTLLLFKDELFKYISLENGGYITALFIAAISSIIAMNNYISATLRGLKLFKEQAILFTSSFPLLMIVSLLVIKATDLSLPGIYQFITVGIGLNVIMLIIVFIVTKNIFAPRIDQTGEKDDIKQLTRYSLPIWFSSSLQSAFKSSDRIMLGMLSTISQVGIYGAGLTFSILFAFPLKAMGPVIQPFIIESYAKNDFPGMDKLYNTMVRWSTLFAIPTFGGLLCFGDHLIAVFGKDFSSAYSVMIILSIAQIISTISGISGTVLNMTEKQNSHARIMIYGFILAITLNLLLIPRYGALGAAIGTGLSVMMVNIFRVRKIIQYYSIKINFAIVFWLILKFTPLVLALLWINQQGILHWSLGLVLYSVISMVILYYTFDQNEKVFIKKLIQKKTRPN